MICFQISIFEPLETTKELLISIDHALWFAFKLVSLNHWKQPRIRGIESEIVVICFQISIFEPLETTYLYVADISLSLWFAFKLVSLNHWKQPYQQRYYKDGVVICFQISIFEPLETTIPQVVTGHNRLWFAFKLVSLNHWKQHYSKIRFIKSSCDLLSN